MPKRQHQLALRLRERDAVSIERIDHQRHHGRSDRFSVRARFFLVIPRSGAEDLTLPTTTRETMSLFAPALLPRILTTSTRVRHHETGYAYHLVDPHRYRSHPLRDYRGQSGARFLRRQLVLAEGFVFDDARRSVHDRRPRRAS